MTRRPARKKPRGSGGDPRPEGEAGLTTIPVRGSIRVEIESEIVGWPSGARFDVLLRGQILSAAPAESLKIRDTAGSELTAISFGQGDAAVPAETRGGDAIHRTGFQVYLPMPGGDGVRVTDLWIRAEGQDGAVFEEAMRLGCIEDKAAILAGPSHDMTGIVLPAPRAIVYLETAELSGEGFLEVIGWTLSQSPIVAVQIFADGARIGAATQGRVRADVGNAYPDYPNPHLAGFALERPMLDGMANAATVTVQVLCLSGACHAATIPLARVGGFAVEQPAPEAVEAPATPDPAAPEPGPSMPEAPGSASPGPASLGPQVPEPQSPGPQSSGLPSAGPAPQLPAPEWDIGRTILLTCDRAILIATDLLRIEGWSACGHGIARIEIEIDGQPSGLAEYGLERRDIAAEYAGLPAGIGFTFEKSIPGLSAGPHNVRVIAFSRVGDEKELVLPVTGPATPAFRFELDLPATRDGVAVDPVTGRMTIEGWALARHGMAGIDVALDGTPLGPAHYGVARPDVGAAFPGWDAAVRSGYTFHCPSRALPDGEHTVQLTARSKAGETYVHAFRITVKKTEDPEEAVSIRRDISRVERDTMFAVLDQLAWRPAFHLIVTGDAAADDKARRLTIGSIAGQSWPNWRATILATGEQEAAAIRAMLESIGGDEAGRFQVIDPAGATAWNASLADPGAAALTAVLAIGDELGRDALGAFAIASGLYPHADFLYADEFRLPPETTRAEAFFKPDFSPTLLMSTNYIGRPIVMKPAVLAATGATAASLTRDGIHDLALRGTEAAAAVHHVRELLSRTDGGTVANQDDGAAALTRALERRGIAAGLSPGLVPGTWNARRTAPVTGKVSIIVPTCAAKGYVETCLTSLRAVTRYQNFEIVCIDNIPDADEKSKAFVRVHADKVIAIPPPFNWSRFNNRAAKAADGEYLLFLNDDVEIIEPDWLDAMLEDTAQPEVGIVGARLLYPNRTIQHAGMFLGANGIGRHAFRYAGETDPGYFGLALTRREVIAVTGACLLVRRAVFDRLGGFDEAHDIVNNDLDFCLRAHRAGLRTIYTPFATLIHHELASRENMRDDFDATRFAGEWGTLFAAGDPYFNPNLSRYSDDYRIDDEGVRTIFSGHPLIHREDVKQILVVKLDHIGDFVTSLPAIRRLKTLFPAAHLTVLAAPASMAFAGTEAAIDAFLPFEFFYERSELGEKTLTPEDLAALTEQLAPYRFDIAVDLRKHLSTRHILQCSGAKILAGYDSLDRFPWLDVALEWEGDKALQHKRNHIADDLLHLVAAIDAACERGRKLIDPRPAAMTLTELPEGARHLFVRPVVAVHPGAGNITKQWPVAHIQALINLLIERNDVSVLLVGGKDDTEVAASIMENSAHPDRIASAVGMVALRDLPRLLATCALYIGNDSGPKHVAAAMGVPTIGVHSGVVDPGEWAPVGERAVAMYRNMSCAPCYLSKAEDCPRGLACIQLLDPALVHQMAEKFLARPVSIPARAPVATPVKKRDRRVPVTAA
ncbi:MAG: glycosyltransferase [Acetobacteraceae bacterium]|nr:glycosyltransferase [Acetobacteraceae bacterium]